MIAKKIGCTTEGTPPDSLIVYAKDHGLQVTVYKNKTPYASWEALKHMGEQEIGMVDYTSGTDPKTDGHYVAVLSADDKLHVFNPSAGQGKKSLDKMWFLDHWEDIDADGTPLKNFAAIFRT